jgi:hypothetical protein
MVQMTVDKVVDVVAMFYLRVAAVGTVDMTCGMSLTGMVRRAAVGICSRHRQLAFVHMIAMRMMQMAIMQVIDVAVMLNRQMSAARTVIMLMLDDLIAGRHTDLMSAVRVCFSPLTITRNPTSHAAGVKFAEDLAKVTRVARLTEVDDSRDGLGPNPILTQVTLVPLASLVPARLLNPPTAHQCVPRLSSRENTVNSRLTGGVRKGLPN